MTADLYMYPAAYLLGIVFNINPSCGSASMVWSSSQRSVISVSLMALIRIVVLAAIGAIAARLGTEIRLPWGILMLVTAGYLLYSTRIQMRAAGTCQLPGSTRGLPWLLAITPPPSGYIGLAIFFGGFNPPTPLVGAEILALIGLGLTTPVWLMVLAPQWWDKWHNLLSISSAWNRRRMIFQYSGAAIFTLVGLAFIFVRGFHRPLLELVK